MSQKNQLSSPSTKNTKDSTLNRLVSDVKMSRVPRLCTNMKRKITNKSDTRLGKSKLQYYQKRLENYIIPKSNRLNWKVLNDLETALNKDKGKKRDFTDQCSHPQKDSYLIGLPTSLPNVCKILFLIPLGI